MLDKENAAARKGIFMIDASKAFIKDGNKNRLRAQDIHKIVDAFTRLAEIPATRAWCRSRKSATRRTTSTSTSRATLTAPSRRICRTLTATCAAASRTATLMRWKTTGRSFPGVRATLFKKADRPGYTQLRAPIGEVKAAIFGHAEFTSFNQNVTALFGKWRKANTPRLRAIKPGGKPKALVEESGEGLLAAFAADG